MTRIILFDGYCSLCSHSIDYIVKNDTNKLYTYVALQSGEGRAYLEKYKLAATHNFDTVVLIQNNQAYIKSTAVLMILKNSSGILRHLHIFMIVPKPIRDFFYSLIAKSRFYFFKKRKVCRSGDPEEN